MVQALSAYPFAAASSAAFYILLILLVFPRTRAAISPLFIHPIPPTQQYVKGFDTLRGLAAALVAAGHSWWATYPVFASTQLKVSGLAYGAKGVPIFAVLSGFLIYRSVLGAVRSSEGLRVYTIRRFFRIFPVYGFSILLCLATQQYVGSAHTTPLSSFVADLFMLNVFSWPGFANPPAWSLYVEVPFYAFLPFMVLVTPRRLVTPLALAGLAIMILADHESRVFGLWKYFLFGIIAAELSPQLKYRAAVPLLALGVVLLVQDFQTPAFDWAARLGIGRLHSDGQSLGLDLSCALILAALPALPRLGAALNIAPLRMIGVISYSVYLIHFFYIRANFPQLELFTHAGTSAMYAQFSAMARMPAWYLPLAFFPGILFWGAVTFLLIERPGIQLGRYILNRSRKAPAAAVAPAE